MILTTEQIITSPEAFGLVTASPLQRAFCRISDGLPLGDLADDPRVHEAIGGRDALALLPRSPPKELHILAGIRTFKSMFAAAKVLQCALAVDTSQLSAGDIVRALLVSLKLELTRPVMAHLIENGRKPLLRPLFVGEPTYERATIRHPSGRPIEVTPIPLDRAGGSAQSTWVACAVFDEEPRMVGEDSGAQKNWDHTRNGLPGRMLDGGQIIGIGAPHAPHGPVYELVQQYHGKPSRDLVILRGRGPDLNPSWWTPERCESLRRTNLQAYKTDVLCEFADAESSLISASDYDASARAAPSVLAPEDCRGPITWVIDPSGRTNAFVLVGGVRSKVGGYDVLRVILARQWLPQGRSLDLENVWHEIGQIIRRYRSHIVWSDQFSFDSNRALARRYRITLRLANITAANKFEMFAELAADISAGKFEGPPDRVFRDDLLSVRRRVTQSGVTVHLPTTPDGRHADFASAAALLHHVSMRAGSPMLAALRRAAGIISGSEPDPDRPPPTNEERLAALRKMREEQDRPAEPPPRPTMLVAASSYDGRLALYHRYDLLGPLYSRPPGYRDPAAEREALAALAMRARRRF